MSDGKRKLKPGATLRLHLDVGAFMAATMALRAEDVGHLFEMLVAEAEREPIPPAPNLIVQRAFDQRARFSRIKGGFGRGNLSRAVRRGVFERDGERCTYCGKSITWAEYQCDHVEPVSLGGHDGIENLAASCRPCNLAKAAKPLSEWLQ